MKQSHIFQKASKYVILFLVALLPVLVIAQNSADDKTEVRPEKGKRIDKEKGLRMRTELKLADRLYAEKSYYTAITYYREALRQDRDNRYGIFWLAQTYRMARDIIIDHQANSQLVVFELPFKQRNINHGTRGLKPIAAENAPPLISVNSRKSITPVKIAC